MALMPVALMAVEAEIDGLWYELVSKANMKRAKVIKYKDTPYSGDIVIPAEVEYEGVAYSVTTIGESAFSYCYGLSSITIPSSVISIEGNIYVGTFANCYGLTSVYISDLEAWCKISFINYDSNPLYFAHHLYLNGEEVKDIIIPNTVTSIGDYAFFGCTSLTSVTIPSSITSIGESAFKGSTSLTSVTIPSSVTSIGEYAFSGCTGLTSVYISDLEAWCKISFGFASNPLSYAHHLYLNGEEVKDLIIPNTVTSIGKYAFRGCTGLTSVTIPSSVTSIWYNAFSGCTSLTSVTIPSSVTYIDGSAFAGCTGLTSVTIPSSVTSIGGSAFQNCSELTYVYCYAETAPSTYPNLFDGSYIEYSTLHVPASAIESYRTTAPWSGFGKIVALDGDEQCATPTIYYNSGKLSFKSDTEGATFVSEIKDADVKKFYDSEIALGVTYNISVYATRDGYRDSEVATATLCWIDVEPQKEGISDDEVVSVKEMKAQPVLIQRSGNGIAVTGAPAGTPIAVYDLSGQLLGCATATAETTRVQALNSEKVVVVKIGERAVKVAK